MRYTSTRIKRSSAVISCAALTVAAFAATALPAHADEHGGPTTPSGYSVQSFSAVGKETGPDDVTRLGDSIYVTFQNGIGPMGEPSTSGATSSTIQQYGLDGRPGKSWQVLGKVDGLTADSSRHRLLITANEDGNSRFSTLSPDSSQPLKTYAYSGLTHGGGTDAISVSHGSIFVSASAPTVASGPAVYKVELDGSTAALTPVFADNSTATAVNGPTAGQSVTLALTDPDSNAVVPRGSARFAGDFVLDAQGDQQLIFAHRVASNRQTLKVLSVDQPLDDTAFATEGARTLWITDPGHNKVDKVVGPFAAGQAMSTVTPNTGATYLVSLNLSTGVTTPIPALASIQPKGLLFTSAASHGGNDDGNGDDNGQR